MSKPTRTALLLATVIAVLALSASKATAQILERLEVGGNYSYVRANAPAGVCGCFSMNGGAGWVAYNFTSSLAVVGEVGGTHASNIDHSTAGLTLASFLGGPRYSWHPMEKIAPFAQLLIGGDRASGALTPADSGLAGSASNFAATAGGGIDLKLTPRLSIRAAQLDYYFTHFDNGVNNHQNNLRFSVGAVFRFGRR